jgi:hypothetical protein
VQCPKCGAVARANESHLGRDLRCPRCQELVQFVAASVQPPRPSPDPSIQPQTQSPTPPPRTQPEPTSINANISRHTEQCGAQVSSASRAIDHFDTHEKISAWIAGGGLLILGLSPFFKWIKLGAGGITGLAGDGKILLAVTVIAAAAYAAAIVKRKWLTPVLLSVQAWGTIALFWMGALIWKLGSIFESPDLKGNPFAAMLSTMLVSPGAGLYLGLIGGGTVAGALGFLAVRLLLPVRNLKTFYASQAISCVLGILLAVFVGPNRAGQSASRAQPNDVFSGLLRGSAGEPENPDPSIQGIDLRPFLASKRLDKQDFQDFIWLDIDWTASTVKKPIRAVKGRLHLLDVFGDSKFAVGWTINRPLSSGDQFTEKGVGFKYNQFMDSHAWVLATEKDNMKLRFKLEAVVYQDGTMEGGDADAPRNSILTPKLLASRFEREDFQEFVWFDIEWDTSQLKKPTRAVKGVLHITDLFGDPHLSINSTIDSPLQPGQPQVEKGVGFKYNQFMDSHNWVRAARKEDMRLIFVPKAVIYSDGSQEDL